jgi:hypothetical protein
MKKIITASLIAIVAIIAVMILMGFYEAKLPFTEEYKERELMKQYLLMYGEEDDLDEAMDVLKEREKKQNLPALNSLFKVWWVVRN